MRFSFWKLSQHRALSCATSMYSYTTTTAYPSSSLLVTSWGNHQFAIPLFNHQSRSNPKSNFSKRFLSTSNHDYKESSVPGDEIDTTSPSTSSPSTTTSLKEVKLKQLIRPFLLSYHPDRIQNTTNITKEANLKAIQTLNGMIDTIDQIFDRAMLTNNKSSSKSKVTSSGGRIELQSKYTIEFLVPSNDGNDDPNQIKHPNQKVRKRKEAISTRRSVDLNFTKKEQSIIQSIDTKTGSYSKTAAKVVKLKAMKEIRKLLQVAGLNVPLSYQDDVEASERDIENDALLYRQNNNIEDVHERMILEELELFDDDDFDNSRSTRFGRSYSYSNYDGSSTTSSRPKTKYEKSREAFMKRVDWKEHARLYDEAEEDMKRDLATDGLIKMDYERKQRMIAEIIARVRVYDPSIDGSIMLDEDYVEDQGTVDTLEQLIAIRRISLLFNDNFDELEMEDMGKMWENVFIVLTPERAKGPDKSGAPFSRRRRLREGQESGFKFAFLDEGKLSVHVPIDFKDDELIGELQRHLEDFFDLCVGDGLAQFFPPNYKENFSGHPIIE